MSEDIDHVASCISEALSALRRLTIPELSALLGEKRQLLARALAWLLLRGMIAFRREENVLYVTFPETPPYGKPLPARTPQAAAPPRW
jgi:hypothetical protein